LLLFHQLKNTGFKQNVYVFIYSLSKTLFCLTVCIFAELRETTFIYVENH
jgi:hypothetical protein